MILKNSSIRQKRKRKKTNRSKQVEDRKDTKHKMERESEKHDLKKKQ